MSIIHKLVETRRLLSDRRLRDEIVEKDRRVSSRRAALAELQRRVENRRKEELVVGNERRERKRKGRRKVDAIPPEMLESKDE